MSEQREEEIVYIYEFSKEEKASDDCPGSDAQVELQEANICIFSKEVNIYDKLSNEVIGQIETYLLENHEEGDDDGEQ